MALTMTGADDEAMAVSEGLLAAADATGNPHVVCYALMAYGMVHRHVDPVAAYEAHRRGLQIAQDSGNRFAESYHAGNLGRLAATHAEATDALDYVTVAIRNFHDSGSFSILPSAIALLAMLLDRLGHYEPAATISGFAATTFTRTTNPEFDTTIAHLREVLGDEVYEALCRAGENMTIAAVATYAYDQIDQARTELEHPS